MKVKYCHTTLKHMKDRANVALSEIPLDKIPSNILEIIRNHEHFEKSQTFGEPGLGSPEEYEKLEIIDGSGTRTFEYFNKAIYYMFQGTEHDRPVFQVFANLDMLDG